MESWEVVVIGAGPAALRAAIASSDCGVSTLLVDSAGIGSRQGQSSLSGIASSINEINSVSHREDTIVAGGENIDKIVAAQICGESVPIVSELERWGLVFRRDQEGLPHTTKIPGHSKPRLSGCGDSSVREITRILEEQAIKRKITRRYDNLAVSLINDNKQIRGVVVLDILTGQINVIQAKTVILATEGYEGMFSNPSEGAGTGLALAARAGISLKGIFNFPKHPLTIKGTNIHLPIELLGEGGRIRKANGDEAIYSDVDVENCVLDIREINNESKLWFSNILDTIKDRTGLNYEIDVIPVSSSIITTGGIPVDHKSRVTLEKGKMWFTGLYAAGRSANTGMHGDGLLHGNILLEDLFTGKQAGIEAGKWSSKQEFANSSLIQTEQNNLIEEIKSLYTNDGNPVGHVTSTINILANNLQESGSENTIRSMTEKISEISKFGIKLNDKSKVMNTELLTAMQVLGFISILNIALVDD